MDHQAPERNPFMLMLNPEVVLAAVAKSERLGQLNRHLCRPLDRPAAASASPRGAPAAVEEDDDLDDAEEGLDAPL